jgi:hypothetical protein
METGETAVAKSPPKRGCETSARPTFARVIDAPCDAPAGLFGRAEKRRTQPGDPGFSGL